jgi:hypothetical protein
VDKIARFQSNTGQRRGDEVVETRASDAALQGADTQTCLFLSDGTEVSRDDAGRLFLSTTGERLMIPGRG